MSKRPSHLIIPDSHVHPGCDNKRFELLGKFIAAERPDVVVNLGDFADLPSLSRFDKGKLTAEGRRVKKDFEAVWDAQERLLEPIEKVRGYKPRLVLCYGNHEARIERVTAENPELAEWLSLGELLYEKFGWEVHPFLEPVEIDTITYCHYFVSGVMGRGIGGENIGTQLCQKLHLSAVQGHSHLFSHSERTAINGKKIFGLSAGCFTHPGYKEEWNRATVNMWWRGVVLLKDIDGAGYYDEIRAVTLRKLQRDFG